MPGEVQWWLIALTSYKGERSISQKELVKITKKQGLLIWVSCYAHAMLTVSTLDEE